MSGRGPATDSAATPGKSPAESLAALEALFHQALELRPEERAAWVDRQLADDPRQARLLKRMLEQAEVDMTGVGSAISDFARDSAAPRNRSGETIGRYRLLSRIRYGGMAEIYRATRDDGEFELEAALKVVRGDRVRPELNALFAAERALMARLNHPNIIRIFDGGTTNEGEAWFVMELLDGLPLVAAARHYRLDSQQLLGHLQDLCAAIGHVHSQLIVHRDIKPENVLLCRTPQGLSIKLLDFGIAAQLQAGLVAGAETALETSGSGWYSPGYAAPETRNNQPPSAATDIYSLGRLLLDCVEMVQPRYREELRAIGEKASQALPEQRYASMSHVLDELDRMRRREPISVFRQRRLHVLQRAMERHRWALAVSLLVLTAASTWLWRETALRVAAEQATARAEVERDRAGAMRDFLLRAFDSSNPSLNRGEEPRVSDLVVEQLDLLQGATHLDPDAHYQLLSSFGDLLLHLDRRDLADRAFVQATELIEAQGAKGDLRWVKMMSRRGQIASRDGRFGDADDLFEQAGAAFDQLPASLDRARESTGLYSAWAANAQRHGELDEAARLIRLGLQAKAVLQAAGDPAGDDAAMRVTLGAILSARGDLAGALDTFQQAYQGHLAAGKRDTFEHLALLGWLGITLDRLGRATDAEPYLVEAVAVAEKLFPKPHSKLSGSYANLGRLYLNQGRLTEAEPLLRHSLAVSEAAGDAGSPDHALRLNALGLLAHETEHFAEAARRFEEAIALSRSTLGPTHQRTLTMRLALMMVIAETHASAVGMDELEQLRSALARAPQRIEALLLLARLAATRNQGARAKAEWEQAHALMAAADSASPDRPKWRWLEGRALLAMQQIPAARDAFLDAARLYQDSARGEHPDCGRALLQAALLSAAGSDERQDLGAQARAVLTLQLNPPAPSLALLDSL
ncbi:MAG: tetratricopeptide repeat protein [Lysobacterales bacterium]